MSDVSVKSICDVIRNDFKPKKSRWYCIGIRNGRKLWMTESALRLASVDEICSDKSISPAPLRFRRNRRRRR